MLHDRAAGKLQTRQGVVVLGNGLVFLREGQGQAALDVEQIQVDGLLAQLDPLEFLGQRVPISLAFRAAILDQPVPFVDALVLLRQGTGDAIFLVLENVIGLGKLRRADRTEACSRR